MSTVSQLTPVPHLLSGQKIKTWKRAYLAATATLTDAQQLALLPAYVHRTEAEIIIAEQCSKKETPAAAIIELELLIDGAPNIVSRVNEFWGLKPVSTSYSSLIGFYFVLKSEATMAGVSNDMVLIKYLHHIPGGEKIQATHQAKFKSTMTATEMETIFKIAQTKLMTNGVKTSDTIKEEKMESGESSMLFSLNEAPAWAVEMKEEIRSLREERENEAYAFNQSRENEAYAFNQSTTNSRGSRGFRDKKCFVCNAYGHLSFNCKKRKCAKCNRTGHHESRCYSDSRESRSSPAQGL